MKTATAEEQRKATETVDPEAVVQEILADVPRTEDYSAYLKLCRRRNKIATKASGAPCRIAVLGGATTDFLDAPLRLELESRGIAGELHVGDYNTYAHEMLDPGSRTVAFGPDVAVVLLSPLNVADWPEVGEDDGRVRRRVEASAAHWLGLCEALHHSAGCEIVMSNFHPLPSRPLGNLGARVPWDRNRFLRLLNEALVAGAPDYLHIFDIESLAATYGTANWFDSRYWHHAKQPVAFDCVVPFVRRLGGLIAGIFGQTAKCLVLDLDNTLWGGVVGDDGVEGLKLGHGSAEGEAFLAFQEYLLHLKDRGVILAVASKNEDVTARAAVETLPDMALRLADFAVFKASWSPKTEAIQEIARELNIGLDAIVFVDDNPAERELVRQTLPQVRVAELTADPSDYPEVLDRSCWFEIARLTDEDRRKSAQYRENAERADLEAVSADYESYLASLGQRAIVRPFDMMNLDRIAQLINKTNQFNLTTRRRTRSEVEALMGRDDIITLSVRLADRFGDNGLIAVMIGVQEGQTLRIDTWLMSCRVFKRGVEHMMVNALMAEAARRGVSKVTGVYVPTARNGLVADLYADLGFEKTGETSDGATTWQIAVNAYERQPAAIEIVEEFE